MVWRLIASVCLLLGFPVSLLAEQQKSDDELSLEFLEYLIDMECDSDVDCVDFTLLGIQGNQVPDKATPEGIRLRMKHGGQLED